MSIEEIQDKINDGELAAVFAKDGTEEMAKKAAELLKGELGIGQFTNESTGEVEWGILVSKANGAFEDITPEDIDKKDNEKYFYWSDIKKWFKKIFRGKVKKTLALDSIIQEDESQEQDDTDAAKGEELNEFTEKQEAKNADAANGENEDNGEIVTDETKMNEE